MLRRNDAAEVLISVLTERLNAEAIYVKIADGADFEIVIEMAVAACDINLDFYEFEDHVAESKFYGKRGYLILLPAENNGASFGMLSDFPDIIFHGIGGSRSYIGIFMEM